MLTISWSIVPLVLVLVFTITAMSANGQAFLLQDLEDLSDLLMSKGLHAVFYLFVLFHCLHVHCRHVGDPSP